MRVPGGVPPAPTPTGTLTISRRAVRANGGGRALATPTESRGQDLPALQREVPPPPKAQAERRASRCPEPQALKRPHGPGRPSRLKRPRQLESKHSPKPQTGGPPPTEMIGGKISAGGALSSARSSSPMLYLALVHVVLFRIS